MDLTATHIGVSRDRLILEVAIRQYQDGPVKFAQVTVPWSLFDSKVRADLLAQFDKLLTQHLDTEPLW